MFVRYGKTKKTDFAICVCIFTYNSVFIEGFQGGKFQSGRQAEEKRSNKHRQTVGSTN